MANQLVSPGGLLRALIYCTCLFYLHWVRYCTVLGGEGGIFTLITSKNPATPPAWALSISVKLYIDNGTKSCSSIATLPNRASRRREQRSNSLTLNVSSHPASATELGRQVVAEFSSS